MPETRLEKLGAITARVLGIKPERVIDDLSRENTEAWDSFNHLLLVSEVERELGIQLSMEEVESIRTYRQLKDAVRSRG